MADGNTFHTGGCQCGAVRYRAEGELGFPRVCQKAEGSNTLTTSEMQR